jgi:hypothetical protein
MTSFSWSRTHTGLLLGLAIGLLYSLIQHHAQTPSLDLLRKGLCWSIAGAAMGYRITRALATHRRRIVIGMLTASIIVLVSDAMAAQAWYVICADLLFAALFGGAIGTAPTPTLYRSTGWGIGGALIGAVLGGLATLTEPLTISHLIVYPVLGALCVGFTTWLVALLFVAVFGSG